MKKKFLIVMCFFYALPLQAKHLYLEKDYQYNWCNAMGGQVEYVLSDGTRVDCLLPDMAVEVDFANKWAECIGQALYYGIKTNRVSACLLIMENGTKDLKYLNRLIYASKSLSEFRIFTIESQYLRK